MTEVKICGITNLEDGWAACECGADALGFVFHPGSPRYLLPEKAAEIIGELPPAVAKVGVFVNEDLMEVRRICSLCGLDFVQLHGNEDEEYCLKIPSRWLIKAIRLENREDLAGADRWGAGGLLVDSWDPQRYGGTGRLSNWSLAALLAGRRRVILAGGLRAENVADAIRAVSPEAVDCGSGVEKSPGKKDHAGMKRFIQEVRGAERGGLGGIFSARPLNPPRSPFVKGGREDLHWKGRMGR